MNGEGAIGRVSLGARRSICGQIVAAHADGRITVARRGELITGPCVSGQWAGPTGGWECLPALPPATNRTSGRGIAR